MMQVRSDLQQAAAGLLHCVERNWDLLSENTNRQATDPKFLRGAKKKKLHLMPGLVVVAPPGTLGPTLPV